MTATVSIVTYTALEHAKRCIASVLACSDDYNLILTANGSERVAAHFQRLTAQHPNIRVVVNEDNEGFIVPNRRALEMTTTPLFVMLNDDTIVCPKWLDMLRAPFAQHPKAALSGPISGCTCLSDRMTGIPGKSVEYLEGSCLMGRTEILKVHGLFSPEIAFAYGEDSDLCLRMREAGYTIHQVPFRLPYHVRGATARTVPGLSLNFHANHQYLQKRWATYLNNGHKFPHEHG